MNEEARKTGSQMDFIRCSEIEPELFLIEKRYRIRGKASGMDITGPFWMLIRAKAKTGKMRWLSGARSIKTIKDTVWLYVPPYSWTIENGDPGTDVAIEGLFSNLSPGAHWPLSPCLIYSSDSVPASLKEVSRFFSENKPEEEVSLQPHPNGVAQKVKFLLDKTFAQNITMNEISKKLKTSNPVISRQFRAAFGRTPMAYKRGLRVTAAMFHLLSGKTPAETASLCGYNDLGRFYKQFKEYIKLAPDSHRIQKGQKTPRRPSKFRLQKPTYRGLSDNS